MKILKTLSIIIGTVAITFGLDSCKKDDNNECCTFSYQDDDVTYTFRACEDGKITYSYTGGETETYSWKEDYDTWEEVRSLMVNDYDATCN